MLHWENTISKRMSSAISAKFSPVWLGLVPEWVAVKEQFGFVFRNKAKCREIPNGEGKFNI